MALIKWRSSYATGISPMDEQHKKIIELINKLYTILREDKDHETLTAILEDMDSYAIVHLRMEEDLLIKYNYPDTLEHREKHLEYLTAIKELTTKLDQQDGDKKKLAQEIYKYLRDWWLDHIVEIDTKYGPFLKDKGVE